MSHQIEIGHNQMTKKKEALRMNMTEPRACKLKRLWVLLLVVLLILKDRKRLFICILRRPFKVDYLSFPLEFLSLYFSLLY